MATSTGIGSRLREARGKSGLTRRDIAEATKMSMAAIKAIDHDELARLPGGIYTRAYLRAYAVQVGVDPAPLVREYVARYERPEAPPGAAPAPHTRQRGMLVLVAACAACLLLLGSYLIARTGSVENLSDPQRSTSSLRPPASDLQPPTSGVRPSVHDRLVHERLKRR